MSLSTSSSFQTVTAASYRALTNVECRSWLCDHDEGRLGYQTGRGPRAVVTRYRVINDMVVLVLPEYNEICQYAPERTITLNVSALTDNDTFTEVVVTGTGHLADNEPLLDEATEPFEHWPTGVTTHTVRLDLTKLEGSVWSWRTEPVPIRPPRWLQRV
jgi:hypothetical protein